jgi:hypothetical protein
MKRLVIIAILLISVLIQAHEVSFIYSVLDDDLSNQTVEKGWTLNFVSLRWGNNDFSDYALSLSVSNLTQSYTKVEIDQAWLRLPIYDDLKLRVGKQIHDFSAGGKSGSC